MKCMRLFYGGEAYPLTEISNWSVTSKIGGTKTIQFDIAPQAQIYKYIEEEGRIEYDGVYYNIKSINERWTTSTVTAEIDLDGLRGNIFQSFVTKTVTLAETLEKALDGTGWSVNGAGLVSAKRSMDLTDVTPLDIVNKCTNSTIYNVSFDVDNVHQILNVSVPSTAEGNVYFTDQLNLKELNFKGSSGNFVTRLYAYGKDGLSFADINNGKPYVDNNSYSDKIISMVWRDERYTVKENLLEDTREKLAKMAVPERSYACSIIDLARLNETEYADFYIRLNSIITLIDRRRKTRFEHVVVEIKEYPNEPYKNIVTLSTAPEKLSGKLTGTSTQLNSISATVNKQPSMWEQAIQTATALITGAAGGYVVLNPSEKPSEILIMDTDDISTAKNVWRWNSNGLGYSANGYGGPYTTAITMDGKIVADFITAGGMNAERITAGTLQGVKIVATTGSIANWTMRNGVLVSSDGSMKLDSNSNTLSVYDSDEKLKMQVNQQGVRYYQDGEYLGFIGTNVIVGTDKRGLNFNLDLKGDHMSWNVKEEEGGNYLMKLTYYRQCEAHEKGFVFNDNLKINGNVAINGTLTVNGQPIG